MSLIEKEPIMRFIQDGLNNKHYGHVGVEIITEVEYSPTIDAVPLVHARWEADGTCSACKNRSFSLIRNEKDGAVNFVGGSYCPICGARMDGEAE